MGGSMHKQILVIDDNEFIRKSFVLSLIDTEYHVDTVDSGEEALGSAKRIKYDLIYLDLHMPGMDGIETLRALRKIDLNVPIYIMTAYYSQYAEQLKKAQAEEFAFNLLNKPLIDAQILSITRGILNGSYEYLTAHKDTAYEFKLFITGRSVNNGKTIADIKRSLEASLPGRYTLDIIDVIEKPDVAYEAKVMMTPTLVKTSPRPAKNLIGNFSNGHFLKML